MDIAHLRSFTAVAEHMGFRRAAERLFLSQPTISAHVAALERELGATLFDRSGRRTRLTAEGERLLPYAQRLLALHDEAARSVGAWRQQYDERLRLIASIFVAASVLPIALRRFAAERPRVELSLRTAFSREVVAALAAGDAELGLSRLPPAGEGVEGRRLIREPVLAAAPAAWGGISMAEALQAGPLLTHNHPGYWDRVLARIAALGFSARAMEVRQVDVTRRLIAEGIGWSFLPRSAVVDLAQQGGPLRVVPPLPGLALPEAETWALWPEGRVPTASGERLVALVAEAVAGATAGE